MSLNPIAPKTGCAASASAKSLLFIISASERFPKTATLTEM